MTNAIVCLDTSVWVKFLVVEEPAALSEAAERLVRRVTSEDHIVAPAFAWVEVGSVLLKKVRQQQLLATEAEELWTSFGALPLDYVDSPALLRRSWQIANQYSLPTLYDATFLACTEMANAPTAAVREFWTADGVLLNALAQDLPPYVRSLANP